MDYAIFGDDGYPFGLQCAEPPVQRPLGGPTLLPWRLLGFWFAGFQSSTISHESAKIRALFGGVVELRRTPRSATLDL